MIAEERHSKILNALKTDGALSVAEACKLLHVSRMTIHRDLESLSSQGLLRKVHGGAVTLESSLEGAIAARSFSERRPANAAAKAQIARHLTRILSSARTLAFDASSTVYELCPILPPPPSGQNLFIITNGIPLFQELLRRNVGFRLALTGGELHPRTESLVGPLAIKSLEGLRFDYAIVSAAGIMEDTGEVYDLTPEGAAMKLAFLSRATHKVLAVDKSKFNTLAPYPLGTLSDFDLLATEDGTRELRKVKGRLKTNG